MILVEPGALCQTFFVNCKTNETYVCLLEPGPDGSWHDGCCVRQPRCYRWNPNEIIHPCVCLYHRPDRFVVLQAGRIIDADSCGRIWHTDTKIMLLPTLDSSFRVRKQRSVI